MVYDYCVVGGGIVDLATAMKLLEMQPGTRLVVLEKETGLSRHQTGYNSGVIHARGLRPWQSESRSLPTRLESHKGVLLEPPHPL